MGTKGSPPLKVVMADPHQVFAEGLAALMSDRPQFELVASRGSAEAALEDVDALLRSRDRALLIVDLRLEGDQDAFWLIREMRHRSPAATVLATGVGIGMECIAKALFLGANGFVSKVCDSRAFFGAMVAVSAGELVLEGMPSSWLGSIAENVQQRSTAQPVLSQREIQVLRLSHEGLSAKSMGARLGLTERTINSHLRRIYRKLGVNCRVSALRKAQDAGLLAEPAPSTFVEVRASG